MFVLKLPYAATCVFPHDCLKAKFLAPSCLEIPLDEYTEDILTIRCKRISKGDSLSPNTPGNKRQTASMTTIAGISPPVKT